MNHLKQSSNFVNQGNAEQANNYLNLAKQSLQKFHEAESASAKAWDSQLAKAEMIAKIVQTAADHSLSSLASVVPGAKPIVESFLLGRNFYFDTKMYGINEATKNGITPSFIETSSAPYVPTLSLRGSGFNNITQIIFNWTGVVSGSAKWNKGDLRVNIR